METNLNKLLKRQIKRHFGSADTIPIELESFIQDINDTYTNFDEDSKLIQNSIEISSQELKEAFQKLKRDSETQKETIRKVKEAISALNPSEQNETFKDKNSDSNNLLDSLIRLIEDNKQVEEALRQSEFRMKSLTNTAQDAILMMDTYGRVSFWNAAAERIFGYTEEEAVGQVLHDFIVPKMYHQSHHQALPEFQLTGQGCAIGKTLDLTALRKDGLEIAVQLSLSSFQLKDGWHSVGILRDITERKQMENQLKENENFQRSLLENIAVGIVIIDPATRKIESVNTFASALIGESAEKIIGRTCHQYMCPAQEHNCPVCDKGQEVDNSERILLRTDKSGINVLKTVKKIQIGGKEKLLESFVDITVQKKAERALQQSLQKWEAIISASPDGIGVISLDGKLQLLSEKLATMFGYSSEESKTMLGKSILDFIDPSNHAILIENIHKLLTGEKNHRITEYIGVKKDSSRFFVDANSTVLLDSEGKPTSILFVERDITERKHAEDALNQVSTRLSLATRAGGVGVWDLDLVNNNLVWDDQMFALYKISKEDFSGAYEAWKSGLHPEDMERSNTEIQMAIRGEKEFDTEFRVIWPDGSIHNIKALAIVQRDNSGKPLHILGTNWDITEQKKTESILLKAKQDAEIANKSKSLFLANMSHEIRTPLNAIIGFSQLMNRDKLLTDLQREYNISIMHAGEHLLALINDILELSKVEAGRVVLNPTNIDLKALLDEIKMIFNERVQAKNLQFIFETADDFPSYVLVDEHKLRQIFLNLIGNAVKFTDHGGIAVRARVDKIKEGTNMLVVEIQDSGVGIAESELNNLFKHFVQTSSGIKKGSGTGLGLALSRELARIMGGDITASSHLGKGSIFTFRVEIQEGRIEDLQTNSSKRVIGLDEGQQTNRILVVDDKEENLKVVVNLLKIVGFETNEAINGEDAIVKFENWNPHLILMDMRMPIMDGYEATRRIKATEKGKITPIIALTASSFEEERKKMAIIGMQGYIRKPFTENELFDTIGHNLGLTYIYEDLDSPLKNEYLNDPDDIESHSTKLQNTIVVKMLDAIAVADLDLLIDLINSIKPDYPELAQHLLFLTSNYDYDSLQIELSEHLKL